MKFFVLKVGSIREGMKTSVKLLFSDQWDKHIQETEEKNRTKRASGTRNPVCWYKDLFKSFYLLSTKWSLIYGQECSNNRFSIYVSIQHGSRTFLQSKTFGKPSFLSFIFITCDKNRYLIRLTWERNRMKPLFRHYRTPGQSMKETADLADG